MKSNVSGRVVPQPGSSSGCRPHNFFYNFHHQQNQSQQQQQHQQHHHQQQHNISYHPHHHHQQQQQQPPPHHQNYAMLPCFNQHNTNGWAGIPLISTAASTNRRQRKPTVVGGGPRHPPQQPMSSNSLQMYNSNRDLHSNEYDLNPMTRLAMHTQGAPLLLTGSYNRNRMNCNRQLRPLNPNSSEGYSPCSYKSNGPIHQKTKENNLSGTVSGVGGVVGGGGSSSNPQADSTAVTCLPRIIKPRKRRKKDRKPLPNSNNFVKKIDHDTDAAGLPKREYPLYIDQQHQQHTPLTPSSQMLGGCFNEFETRCNLKNDEPNHVTDAQDPATGYICFCRQCDPLSRIWAFPLRRSHSDNSSDTTEFERATIKNVGVIGSNRSNQVNNKNTNHHHTGSLSDSSDSGYGDILNGIQIGDNFFTNDNNNNNNYLQLQKLPNDLLLSPTAETLLTESINEISRKLMETCDIKGANAGSSSSSASSASSDSCSVFSDSGLSSATSNNPPSGDELIFNFENLSINSLNNHNLLFPTNNNIHTNATSESMFDCFSTSDINNNTIHVPGDGGGSPRIDPQLFNCLDMLWGTQPSSSSSSSSSLHSDAPKQTTSPSSSSSFYRPAVASM